MDFDVIDADGHVTDVGDDQIVYASDFPHWDHGFPKSIAELKGRPDLSDAQKLKVLADNARRLYRLV